jgi:hypothetical protein
MLMPPWSGLISGAAGVAPGVLRRAAVAKFCVPGRAFRPTTQSPGWVVGPIALRRGASGWRPARLPSKGPSRSGPLDSSWLGVSARKTWAKAGLTPIMLQEACHTAATWLDASGVPPKIASVLMGHATPARHPRAAQITLARHTRARGHRGCPRQAGRARGLASGRGGDRG